jgi:hypothetical protein
LATGLTQEWTQSHKDDPLHKTSLEEFRLDGKWITPPRHTDLRAPVLVLQCQPGIFSWSQWDGSYRADAHGKMRGKLLESWIATGTLLDGTTSVMVEYRLDNQKLKRGNLAISNDRTAAMFHYVNGTPFYVRDLLFGRQGWRKEAETYQTHTAVLGMSENLAADFVMQFDLPDVTQVADSCGLIEHSRK